MGSARRLVWILLAVALLASLAVAAYAFVSARNSNEQTMQTARAAAKQINVELGRYVALTTNAATTAAQNAPNLRGNRPATERFLIQLLASAPSDVVHGVGLLYSPYSFFSNKRLFAPYAHRTGQGRIAVTYSWSRLKYQDVQQVWYRAGLQAREQTLFTQPYFDADHVYITAVHPIIVGGSSLGVAIADTTSGGFDAFLARLSIPQMLIYLLTPSGHVMAFPQPNALTRFAGSRHPVRTILDVTEADVAAFIARRYPGERVVVRSPAADMPAVLVTSFAAAAVGGTPPPRTWPIVAIAAIWLLTLGAIAALRRMRARRRAAMPPRVRADLSPVTTNGKYDLQNALQSAIARDEIHVDYQPIYSIADHRLVGFEALMRWQPAGQPVMKPSEFIAVAESSGLVLSLDRYVAALACQQMSQWQQSRDRLRLEIKASPLHFEDVSSLRELIAVLQRSDLRPQTLEVELSETGLMGLKGEAVATVRELHASGIRLHLDDFGTGQSSLAYLQSLHVDALKIDRRFIGTLPEYQRAMHIVKAIVTLARTLRVEVIAEGVETEAQARVLLQLGVTMGQGFLYGAPMPAEEAQQLI